MQKEAYVKGMYLVSHATAQYGKRLLKGRNGIMCRRVKAKPKSKAKGRAKGKHASNATKKTPPTIKRPAGNFKRPAGKRTRKAT